MASRVLFFSERYGLTERDLERYRRVTAADVQRAARQYLTQQRRVVLSVVPQGQTNLAVTQGVLP